MPEVLTSLVSILPASVAWTPGQLELLVKARIATSSRSLVTIASCEARE